MKFPILLRLAVFSTGFLLLQGCYYAIPTVVEAYNQNRLQMESDGAILESKTGALKLIADNDTAVENKLNAYIRGYNSIMVGSWSLLPSYYTFTNYTLKAKSTDTISFPAVQGLKDGLTWLKKGISYEQTSIPELDEAITTAIAAGEKLVTDEQTSLPYFRSQMYRRDGMAGAQKMFPILQKDYEKLINAMNRAGAILFELQKTATEKRMAAYRAKKSMLGYHTEKSLLYAQELLTLFSPPEQSVTDNEKYILGNKLIVEMKAAMASQMEILNKVFPLRDRSEGLDSMHEYLTEMIESYHEMEKKRTVRTFNRMVKRYSDAIEKYNHAIKFANPE